MADLNPNRLAGRTAVVTGAAHGMGRAHALRLAAEGADIVALDLGEQSLPVNYRLGTMQELHDTVEEVEKLGRRALAVKADIRDRSALAEAAEASAAFGRVDILVCNAATIVYGKVLDTSADAWDLVTSVNLTGTFNTIQAFVPGMIANGRGGSIVIASSVAGIKAMPFVGAYGVTKHGLQGLAKVLAQELAQQGIRVNTVNPGPIRTPMNDDSTLPDLLAADPAGSELFATTFRPLLELPEDNYIDPSDVSATVAWLASDDARYVTGLAVPVDAGVMIR
jgi:SDR family mycofactocin-dependent oxidoreductase